MHLGRYRVEKTNFFRIVWNEKALRLEEHGSYLKKLSWSTSLGDVRSELPLKNNPSPESGNIERPFNMLYSHAIKVLLDLVTEAEVQVGQPYAPQESVCPVSPIDNVSSAFVPDLTANAEQRNII